MSIRIVPESERSAGVGHIAPIKLPPLELPYAKRAERLRQLATNHAMADYLGWAADLSDAQQAVAQARPLPDAEIALLASALEQAYAPLHSAHFARTGHWLQLLDALLAQLNSRPSMRSDAVAQAIATLQHSDVPQRQAWANAVLTALRGDVDEEQAAIAHPKIAMPDAGVAQILWSALSLYWRQLASRLPATGVAKGQDRHVCPICSHAPTGSLVLGGAEAGVRYVQCSLCESLWHIVRVRCTSCDSGGKLDYWCLETEKAAVKAETCGDCGSYLKAFYQQVDNQIDVVADDLATLALDAEMDAKGIARSGVNPLMLPELN
ncbi:formate dehydrogenase accessory protein FdhE [Lampropedia puyangensis]|uniref:Protein FdhE homolog n=1 Tax=Lampropedia puyangensis TaxID=1330072 RepID=A0A4S8FDF6_9BURK|nr:formate dehydrogenase accessory protein FdhE [Lampropedia puyangensis]THU05171.1 formate dehydrogenase accessory protein FdhE [Lampropedia puyangensis]